MSPTAPAPIEVNIIGVLEPVPPGYCGCRCGMLAPIAPVNNRGRGWVRDEPLRFIHGHRARLPHAGGPRADAVEKFWAKTDLVDGPLPTPCLDWMAGLWPNGYAKVSISGRTRLGHRLAYELATGILLTPEQVVAHHCDRPRCVAPWHLFLATPKLNSEDAATKGRLSKKLVAGQVIEMRALHAAGWSTSTLAEKFGVHVSTVYRIVTGQAWRHLSAGWVPVPLQPNKSKVACKLGHPFEQMTRSDGRSRRICRTCQRAQALERYYTRAKQISDNREVAQVMATASVRISGAHPAHHHRPRRLEVGFATR